MDAFIYISKDVAEHHTSKRKSRFKGTIIHNGIDMHKFARQYEYDTISVREELGIKPDQFMVGIIGRIDWWKGHEYFIEAIAKASKQIPSLKGLIIGALEQNVVVDLNRRYLEKLRSLVHALDLENKIIFMGARNDVPRIIASLDLVVHASSRPEPFGLVIIEGMAAGKPVVATAAGGVLDIVEDERNGLLVPCRNSDSMARAILQIISNPDRAKKMGMEAQRRVAEKFTVQHQVTAVQKLYDDILEDPHRRK